MSNSSSSTPAASSSSSTRPPALLNSSLAHPHFSLLSGRLIRYIHLAGGDIIKFAGDAVSRLACAMRRRSRRGSSRSSSHTEVVPAAAAVQRMAARARKQPPQPSQQQQQQLADRRRRSASRQAAHATAIARSRHRLGRRPQQPARFPTGFGSNGRQRRQQHYHGCREENYCPPGLGEQVLEAARCCLRMLTDLHGFSPVSGVTLKLHIGIGAGRMTAYTVGGHMKKWYA